MKRILKALKNKYKALGFSEKAFQAVAEFISKEKSLDEDSDDADIETAIGGVEPLLKAFNGDADRRAGTFKSDLEKLQAQLQKLQGAGGENDPAEPEPTEKGGNPEIAQLTKLITGLATTVNGLVEKDKQTSLQARFASAAKEKGISNSKLVEKWMPKTDDDFDTSLEDLITFNTDFAKEESNSNSQGRPSGGGGGGKAGSVKQGQAALDKWATSHVPAGNTPSTEQK